MKTKSIFMQIALILVGSVLAISGCSSTPSQPTSGRDFASTGPTVMNTRSEPGTIELDSQLQPKVTPEVLADVKDFRSKVTEVRLKFTHVPITVPMVNVGGTTWRAELTPQQLQMMAVSGKTIQYDANVIAKNEAGQTAMSQSPVTVTIKAPEPSERTTG